MDKKIRDNCSIELIRCVRVVFKGSKREGISTVTIPEDDGTVHEFMKWMIHEDIRMVKGSGACGSGIYEYCHFLGDYDKIKKWWEDQGIKVEEYE